ncbi:27118_t:CDS:2 [Dentiscutata erythropus]|uniref:27118_t:CDS:1 n=1 Tax=Dentiscutata erythropus TaxID=1348616 RepID=A0A9N9IIF9_9GLOM|nr:27118_t:CDS:2 [Dentiscutata erythropus]
MKPINTILLMFLIVFFLFGVSESILTPRNVSFLAAKIQSGHKNSLKEQDPSHRVTVVQVVVAVLW